MYSCHYCTEYTVHSFKKLLHHIKFIHSNEPNFRISCGYCSQSFKRFESFKSHLRRKHQDKHNDEEDVDLGPDVGNDDIENDDGEDDVDSHSESDADTEAEPRNKLTRSIALFILKTKEENQLSQPAIEAILDNTASLVDESLNCFKEEVRSCLATNGIDVAQIQGMDGLLNSKESKFSKAVAPIGSQYLQMKYFVEKFKFVVSRKLLLWHSFLLRCRIDSKDWSILKM